jgi:hypothetical protein
MNGVICVVLGQTRSRGGYPRCVGHWRTHAPLGGIAGTVESLVSRDQVGELETGGFRRNYTLSPPVLL